MIAMSASPTEEALYSPEIVEETFRALTSTQSR
jgi:hypothetical protein